MVPGKKKDEIAALRNLGPKSAKWLHAVGIHTRADLERLGAVRAYMQVKRGGFNASLNLLYALAGMLLDVHWNKLPHAERSRLVLEVDAMEAAQKNKK
jgi:DNA transformation protein and related proteins